MSTAPSRVRSRPSRLDDGASEADLEAAEEPIDKKKKKKVDWKEGEIAILAAGMKKYPKLTDKNTPIPEDLASLLPRHSDPRSIKGKARSLLGVAFASKNNVGSIAQNRARGFQVNVPDPRFTFANQLLKGGDNGEDDDEADLVESDSEQVQQVQNTAVVDNNSIVTSKQLEPLLTPIVINTTDGTNRILIFFSRLCGFSFKPEVADSGHLVVIKATRAALPASVLGKYAGMLTEAEIAKFETSFTIRLPRQMRVTPVGCEVIDLGPPAVVNGRITPLLVGFSLARLDDPNNDSFKLPELNM